MENFDPDLFSERVEAHIKEAQQERNNTNNGSDSFRPYLRKRVILSDRTAYMLSPDELRYLPKFLCDVTLRTPDAEINADHFQYWSWTGCMMSIHNYIQVSGDNESNNDASYAMTRFDSDILRDLSTLLQVSLMVKRAESLIAQGMDIPAHLAKECNPSYSAVFIDSFRIVIRMSTSILEGLLRRRCNALNKDGSLKRNFKNLTTIERMEEAGQEVSDDLREVVEEHKRIASYVNGERAYLWEALPLWHNEYAKPATKKALDSIDNFTKEKKDNMRSLLGSYMTTISKELEKYNNEKSLFSFLNAVRNPTAHNEQIFHSLGSIFVNLCCMVFWDQFPDAFYENHKKTFFKSLSEPGAWGLSPGFRPIDFYPL